MKLDFDTALEKTGGFGYIQKVQLLLLCLLVAFQAPYNVFLAFIGKEPTFVCKDRPAKDPCQLKPPCHAFEYGKEFTSIVSEWDLVCDRKREATYSQSLLMFGCLIGVVVLGRASDKYGRLKTYMWGMVSLVAVQFASGFSKNLYQFAFSRLLIGFFSGGTGIVVTVLVLEAVLPKVRAPINTIFGCAFTFGLLLLSLMAYYVRDWRLLTFVTCAPMVLLILVPLVIPESARWLASRGRTEKAEDQLMYFAKKNGVTVSRTMISLVDKTDDAKSKNSTGILDLFRTPVLRQRMVILMFIWFVLCLIYYGLTFGAVNLGGNMYINFALSGVVELPGNACSVYVLNRLGRKPTMIVFFLMSSAACIGVVVLMKSEDEMSTLQTYLALTAKMAISVAFNAVYLYSTELLPTVLRNTAVGVCSMSARLGGMVAPALTPYGDKAAYLIYGMTSLLGVFLCLTLPETLNKQLPQTVMDIENGPVTAVTLTQEQHRMMEKLGK